MTEADPTYPPGIYLLDYDGDVLQSYEIVTVNSNGLVEISMGERPFVIEPRHKLTPLAIRPVEPDWEAIIADIEDARPIRDHNDYRQGIHQGLSTAILRLKSWIPAPSQTQNARV